MIIAITNGIKVSVMTEYQPFYSDPLQNHYVFSYKIKIENNSDQTIKVISRHWDIFDSIGLFHTVEGDGVVGLQPVIEPGHTHEYVSGVNFNSTIGRMHGFYLVEKILNGKITKVKIPEFVMTVPYILN